MSNINFLTGGDVAPIRNTAAGMFGDIGPLFERADLSFFNLELPLSDRGEPFRGKAIVHRGKTLNIDGLIEAGVSCVNLANNHILDYGEEAMFDTMELLDRHGIGRFGAGRHFDEARKAHIVEKNGLRVGFLGYSTTLPTGFTATADDPGVNALRARTAFENKVSLIEYPGTAPHIISWTEPADLQRLREDVTTLRQQVDVVIIYMHWGTSMSPQVHDFQREIGKAAIDAGAHALFGGHQHVMSAIEFYKGCPIVHGSANLLFDTWASFFTAETLKSFLFGATLDKSGLHDCYLLPITTGVDVPPRLLPGDDPQWQAIVTDLQNHSRRFDTRLVGSDGAVAVHGPA